MIQLENEPWSVWIDESKKVISVKKIPKAKKLSFKDTQEALLYISDLLTKGYKIG